MDRKRLGLRLLEWHGGQGDPIYAVGSFYVGGQVYPDPSIVDDALNNLSGDLHKFERMGRGERVEVYRNGRMVDLQQFAGYTPAQIRKATRELRGITSALRSFRKKDY